MCWDTKALLLLFDSTGSGSYKKEDMLFSIQFYSDFELVVNKKIYKNIIGRDVTLLNSFSSRSLYNSNVKYCFGKSYVCHVSKENSISQRILLYNVSLMRQVERFNYYLYFSI